MNEYGWSKSPEENRQQLREVQDQSQGRVYADSTSHCDGRFIILLTEINTSGMASVQVNKQRMDGIAADLDTYSKSKQISTPGKCGEVVSQMNYLNMMTMKLSPECTKWLAKRPDIDLIEVDSEVSASNDSSVLGMGVGAGTIAGATAGCNDPRGCNTQIPPRRMLRGASRSTKEAPPFR